MTSNPTERRLQLHALGYRIIPTFGKAAKLTGWNRPDFVTRELTDTARSKAVARITRWVSFWPHLQSTGVWMWGGLGAIDIDVNHPLAEQMMAAIAGIAPEVHATAPTRYGGGDYKRALFVRIEGELFSRVASRKYLRPGADPDDKGDGIEIFGGLPTHNGHCGRHMGVYGPHSYNDDGSVRHEYRWDEAVAPLHETPLADLPALTKAQAMSIADAFDALAREAGWEVVKDAPGNTDAVARVYDIDEELTRFDILNGEDQVAYVDLEPGMRCSSSFVDGGTNRSKCHVGWSPLHDCIMVYDYEAGAAHYPKQFAAPDPHEFAEQMAAIMPEPVVEAPPRPDDKDSMGDKVAWLLQTRGYCEQTDRVIELYKPGDDCQTTRIAFQFAHRAWHVETIGPRGGKQLAYATSGWELNAARIGLEGVRLRPDQPFPVYAEDGRVYKNAYQRPCHEGTGSIETWLRFMEHLLPDPAERGWFCDWLAHKYRFPGIPGVAVIMVAASAEGPIYGAGRGMLRDVLARLFGAQYVRTIDFDVFSGKSAQGVYTDWAAYSLLVTVSEAKDTAEGGKWSERRAVYERIKEIIDPRPVERMFTAKGRPSFMARAVASYLIFSNNFDAVQLPPDDRRATVLRNGTKMAPELAIELQAWMERPGNIAALAGWLMARDLSGFSAYDPLQTATKTRMQELARSDLDVAFGRVRRVLGPNALFTSEMIRLAILGEIESSNEGIEAQIRRLIRGSCQRFNDYRMPRDLSIGKRHWILSWQDGPQVLVHDYDEVVHRVKHAAELLATLQDDTKPGAEIVDFPKTRGP